MSTPATAALCHGAGTRDVMPKAGRRRPASGQEDMIMDIALDPAARRGALTDGGPA
ncbi:hypothetical protein OG909_31170 [Streptomyces sp. NBC_01754]|uniref:hypothetical protein n=1 Tax=Streptomyces sp. NBC_01754 TaxID=2975930 RepID=UPI002DDAFFEE|nr:hypothetical protein [Streptomyces sp. NBC_01754]WSC96409.1 hypothetical protein OG909_31170 [Streptomyces sp. NBC_01754]